MRQPHFHAGEPPNGLDSAAYQNYDFRGTEHRYAGIDIPGQDSHIYYEPTTDPGSDPLGF